MKNYCDQCQAELRPEARFCDRCGASKASLPEARLTIPEKAGPTITPTLGMFLIAVIAVIAIFNSMTGTTEKKTESSNSESSPNTKEPAVTPNAMSPEMVAMRKMTDRELLKSANRLLSGANVAQISKANEDLAISTMGEYEKRNTGNAATLEPLRKRLVTIELARQMKKAEDDLDANPPNDDAEIRCRTGIEHGLRNPGNAKFAAYSDDYVRYLGKGAFHVQVKVNGENGFGGRTNTVFDCKVQCLTTKSCVLTALKELN